VKRAATHYRSGLTLVEIAVAIGLVGVVLSAIHSVLQGITGGYRSGNARMELDALGARAIGRLVEGLRTAAVGTLTGLPESPLYGTAFDSRRSLGFDGTKTEWSDPERFAYSAPEGTLTWTRAAGTPAEKILLRIQGVAPLLAGEQLNGLDDNGNGLVDEPGFCATLDGDLVQVWLCLVGPDPSGRSIERAWSMSIRCRN